MPLTVRHATLGVVDATDAAPDVWAEVHRRGAPLACVDCDSRMVAVRDSLRADRHFSHFRRPEHCDLVAETPEHRAIKQAVAAAIREVAGWQAALEAPGQDPEGHRWRADVLAISPTGRRVAWEVQVSGISEETARERTRRHGASGIDTCWLDHAGRASLLGVPSVRITSRGEDSGEWTVWPARFEKFWRETAVDLEPFIRGVLHGAVTWDGHRWSTDPHRRNAADAARRAEEHRQRIEREAQELRAAQLRQFARLTRSYASRPVQDLASAISDRAAVRGRVTTAELASLLVALEEYGLSAAAPEEALDAALTVQTNYGREWVRSFVLYEAARWRRSPVSEGV